jgi:hypothetical protein
MLGSEPKLTAFALGTPGSVTTAATVRVAGVGSAQQFGTPAVTTPQPLAAGPSDYDRLVAALSGTPYPPPGPAAISDAPFWLDTAERELRHARLAGDDQKAEFWADTHARTLERLNQARSDESERLTRYREAVLATLGPARPRTVTAPPGARGPVVARAAPRRERPRVRTAAPSASSTSRDGPDGPRRAADGRRNDDHPADLASFALRWRA